MSRRPGVPRPLALSVFLALSWMGEPGARAQGIEPLTAFPRSSLTIQARSGAHPFKVWVADTAARRGQGLMFVKRLEPGTGMLFRYGQPQTINMWMKNTLIPLDMLFVDANGRITRIARNAQPRSLDMIGSLGLVTAVIEIGGGESARLGIEPGDRIMHRYFTAN